LREIYAALGNDSFLIQECFSRPALVDRLVRSFLAADARVQAAPRREIEQLRHRLENGQLDPGAANPARTLLSIVLDASTGETGSRPAGSAPMEKALACGTRALGREEFDQARN